MAGSIHNMAAVYQKKTLTQLVDSSNFIINCTAHKFLFIGLDPSDKFNTTIHITTKSRFVSISPDFLKRMFSIMGYVLPFILDQPQKYERIVFLDTDSVTLTSMLYQGKSILVIKSKIQEGCRVYLNRSDLVHLQYLECSIFDTVAQKSHIIRPTVLKLFEMIGDYIDNEFTKVKSPPTDINEMRTFIINLRDDRITDDTMTKHEINLVGRLKMFATRELAEHWEQRWNGEMPPDVIKPLKYINYTYKIFIFIILKQI